MAALVVRDGPSAGQRVDVVGEVELGRADTDALREDAEASRRHAVVRSGPSGLEIEDLGSSNGTWVNDERVAGTRPLQAGDRVRIGRTSFEVEGEPDAGTMFGSAPASPETRVAPTPAAPGVEQPPAEPVAPPAQPAQPAQPVAPVQPYQPDQAATAPQAPVGGGYGQGTGFGQQGTPYAQPPGAYGQPGYGQPEASGGRPAVVSVAGLLLILAGVVTILWTVYDVVLLLGDLESASAFGLASLVYILLALNAVTMVGGLLEIIGGIRAFSLRGRGMAIIGAVLVLVGWGAAIAYIFIQGFRVQPLAWIALVVSVALTVAGLIALLSAGRHFSTRRY
jgi:pSer/pThr/pTyr-binding forkhead associated (FHA) protein